MNFIKTHQMQCRKAMTPVTNAKPAAVEHEYPSTFRARMMMYRIEPT